MDEKELERRLGKVLLASKISELEELEALRNYFNRRIVQKKKEILLLDNNTRKTLGEELKEIASRQPKEKKGKQVEEIMKAKESKGFLDQFKISHD